MQCLFNDIECSYARDKLKMNGVMKLKPLHPHMLHQSLMSYTQLRVGFYNTN